MIDDLIAKKKRLDEECRYRDAIRGSAIAETLERLSAMGECDVIYRPKEGSNVIEMAICRWINGDWRNYTRWHPVSQAGLKAFSAECFLLHDNAWMSSILPSLDRDNVIRQIAAVEESNRHLRRSAIGKANIEKARAAGKHIGRPRKKASLKGNPTEKARKGSLFGK